MQFSYRFNGDGTVWIASYSAKNLGRLLHPDGKTGQDETWYQFHPQRPALIQESGKHMIASYIVLEEYFIPLCKGYHVISFASKMDSFYNTSPISYTKTCILMNDKPEHIMIFPSSYGWIWASSNYGKELIWIYDSLGYPQAASSTSANVTHLNYLRPALKGIKLKV